MKSPFPVTPTMRYEHMLLAAITSGICFFLGLQFGAMTMQVAAETPASLALTVQGPSLRLALFALSSGGFLLLGIAFMLFTLIKIETRHKYQHHFHLFVRARMVGITLVWLAFTFAALWVAANVALQFLK